MAFGWTHVSAVFQILESVAYFVAKAGITLHCYIDDYIAVVPKAKADFTLSVTCCMIWDFPSTVTS